MNPYFSSDKGNEFSVKTNDSFVRSILIEKYRMDVYTMTGAKKGSIIERYNQQLKQRLERYMYHNKTKTWLTALQKTTNNINNSYSRSIGMKPAEVTFKKVPQISKLLYPTLKLMPVCKLKLGDIVRVVNNKTIFTKGYTASRLKYFL